MEYEPDFAKSFMSRTLQIAKTYRGPHDATLLINCMIGLLVVPREALLSKVPDASFESLAEWGIKPGSILSTGRCSYGHEHVPNLRQLVLRMRNAVAHFQIDPFSAKGEVEGFAFKDRNGFHARLSLVELRDLVVKLAEHLERAA